MANKQIHDYPAAISIDAAADYLLIDPASTGAYNKISRNVLLGLSSAPLGTTDSQSPQNKTFDNTNVLTIKDGGLTIQNTASVTKQAVFSAASITAGQTRTFTFPDASGILTTTAGTQTLTNKTITAPAITGGTIDNATITVDSIAGHTSSTIVTIANLQISNGVINSANAVTATSIAAGAVQPQALQSGTGSGWAMQSWAPVWTNFTQGNGTVTARYIQIGKIVNFRLYLQAGSTSSIGGAISFSLPVTSISYPGSGVQPLGVVNISDAGVSLVAGLVIWTSTTTSKLVYELITSSLVRTDNNIDATHPWTFSTGDELFASGWYEAA